MKILDLSMDMTLYITENILFLLISLILTNNLVFLKKHKYRSVLFVIMQTFFVIFLRQHLPLGVHTIFAMVFLFILLHTLFRYNIFTCTISIAASIILISTTELIVMTFLSYFSHNNFSSIIILPPYRLLGGYLTRILQFALLYVFYKTNFTLNQYKIFQKKSSLTTSAILLQSLIMGLLLLILYDSEQFKMIMLVYIIILSLNIFSLIDREKMLSIEKKYIAEREHGKNMEIIIDVIRKEKHEFANQLNTLTALCLLEKENKDVIIEEYAKKLLHNIHSTYRFYDSGNTYVDGLLAVKSNFAAENDILMDVSFDAPLSQIDIDDIDLTSIMGNILDNALEAIKYSPIQRKGIVSIYTYIDYESNRYCISISNNGDMIPEHHMNRIFENRFSTKKHISHTERGYGLFITKQLVDKHSGSIMVTTTEETTEFLLEFKISEAAIPQPLCS